MATRDDVLDAIARIERVGSAGEVTRLAQAALTLPLPPSGYDHILTQLRSVDPLLAVEQQGRSAQAMRRAESVLAGQLSRTAEFDRRIIEALVHARKTTLQGRRRLDDLHGQIADAADAWNLGTASGAIEFQRFLIAKLGEIIAVVEDTNDDDSSKSALAAALAGLYAMQSARDRPLVPDNDSEQREKPASASADDGVQVQQVPGDGSDLDALVEEDPEIYDLEPVQQSAQVPTPPSFPGLGGEGPGFGALPGALPAGLPFAGMASDPGRDIAAVEPDEDAQRLEDPMPDGADDEIEDDLPEQDLRRDDPLVVRLPDGETTTVTNPQLAAAMQAVADGQPVGEAFRSHGLHIPPPGTPVASPVDVINLRPGDIGVFTDRHALAVGAGKALLDGQIHLADNLRGPSFLGWQHPPVAIEETAPTTEPVPTGPAGAQPGPRT